MIWQCIIDQDMYLGSSKESCSVRASHQPVHMVQRLWRRRKQKQNRVQVCVNSSTGERNWWREKNRQAEEGGAGGGGGD